MVKNRELAELAENIADIAETDAPEVETVFESLAVLDMVHSLYKNMDIYFPKDVCGRDGLTEEQREKVIQLFAQAYQCGVEFSAKKSLNEIDKYLADEGA